MRQENLQSKGGFKLCISKEVNEEVGDGCDHHTVMKHLNPVKHCGGCKEQKRDEKILVDTDSGNLKAP